MHPVLEAAASVLQSPLQHSGDLSLLNAPRRVLLVSRAERSPSPTAPWLATTVAATRRLCAAGEILAAGTGRVAYDAALCACADSGGSAVVALLKAPDPGPHPPWLPQRCLLVWPKSPELRARPSPHALLQRDLLAAWLADRGTAIHVRKAGNMATARALLEQRGCPIVRYEPLAVRGPVALNFLTPAEPCRQDAGATADWDYLTHFTRAPDGAWPGEEHIDYLHWLCGGQTSRPRDAFAALCAILTEGRIRACGRLMPGRVPMACFTACRPSEVPALRRWRRGLLRWTFTRCGLAIRRSALEQLGVRPVAYVDGEARAAMRQAAPEVRRFMQRASSGGIDWSAECEWRVPGDVDLSRINRACLLALVEDASQAAHVAAAYGIQALAI